MRGYKVFNPDWTCNGFQYEVGKTYEMGGEIILCRRGFHFCENLADCFNYYPFFPANKVAEVEGEPIDRDVDDSKCVTDRITILREIPWHEVLDLCNIGYKNTGYKNTGDMNTGNMNTGDMNTGNRNTGNMNTGDMNTGNWNTGDMNTGDMNTGNKNTGYMNTGDWNAGDHNAGCFNTTQGTIRMFNKPSNWTFDEWFKSLARHVLDYMPQGQYVTWLSTSEMTPEDKVKYPEYKTTGGCLVTRKGEDRQEWWNKLPIEDKKVVLGLPNFDPKIFLECTGIDVREEET